MRLHTAPSTYTPLTSDFDISLLKIQKQKRLSQQSEWAKNIRFQSTEERYNAINFPYYYHDYFILFYILFSWNIVDS
jgi:hypothetical protein